MFAFLVGAPVESLLGSFFTGFTCWGSFGYAFTIVTLRGYTLFFGRFSMVGLFCYNCTTLGVIDGKFVLSKINARDINASLCTFPSVTIGVLGAGSFSE